MAMLVLFVNNAIFIIKGTKEYTQFHRHINVGNVKSKILIYLNKVIITIFSFFNYSNDILTDLLIPSSILKRYLIFFFIIFYYGQLIIIKYG
jgi:hypothetical protein